MRRITHGAAALLACASLATCGGGGGGGGFSAGPTAITIAGSPAADGVFDPAPMSDGSGPIWMSHSIVLSSPNDARLNQVRTRIARSDDGGATWSDLGIDPNKIADPDLYLAQQSTWATWRFEVSRLLYDPYDSNPAARWKMVWHRILAAVVNGQAAPTPENSWIGYASAAAPSGPWSDERKLFTGSWYNAGLNSIIGAPEFPLDANFPGAGQLGNCAAFTEPGLLARPEGIYVSLQCGGAGKVVLLRCDRAFSTCAYVGDLLVDTEAAPFALAGQSVNAFAATELVESGSAIYLIVTGYNNVSLIYQGCLVFRVDDLATASVERAGGAPVLVKRVAGTPENFNGACGYHSAAGATGIIYSEYTETTSPRFHLFASHQTLP